ncbi:hypothetical protein FOZ63_002125, partial [Perkinsus olseni]
MSLLFRRRFLYPSPWPSVVVSEDGLRATRLKGSGKSCENRAIGAEPLKRHDTILSLFYSVEVGSLSRKLVGGLRMGLTSTTAKGIARHRSVAHTLMIDIPGRETRSARRLHEGSVVTLAVGLDGRVSVLIDDYPVHSQSLSQPFLRGSAPIFPILELSRQTSEVTLVADTELSNSIAVFMLQGSREHISDPRSHITTVRDPAGGRGLRSHHRQRIDVQSIAEEAARIRNSQPSNSTRAAIFGQTVEDLAQKET